MQGTTKFIRSGEQEKLSPMGNSEPETEFIDVTFSVNSENEKESAIMSIPQNQLEIWDEKAEELGLNRSAAVRLWTAAGRRFLDEYDPNRTLSHEGNALDAVIKQHMPEKEENAIPIEEIKRKVVEDIKIEVWDLVLEDDSISRVGDRFYKQ